MAKMTAFIPPPQIDLGNGYVLYAPEGMRDPKEGITGVLHLFNGTIQLRRKLPFNDDVKLAQVVDAVATKTQMPAPDAEQALLTLSVQIEDLVNLYEAKDAHIDMTGRYVVNDHGTFLKHATGQGDWEEPLANFSATIVKDIVFDDETPEVKRRFALEVTVHGTTIPRVFPEAEFDRMRWPLKVLGTKAMVEVGPFKTDHLRLAILSTSTATEQTVFGHTGWRQIGDGRCYLHANGAIDAQGMRDDITVELAGTLASYALPAPPTDLARIRQGFRASLGLRTLAPGGAMMTVLGLVYLAPLRPFLVAHLPDFVGWLVGASGRFKTEYAVLGMQHFGADFTSRNIPSSFTATGNSLERLSHAAKDSLLLTDDYYPASDRRSRDAMEMAANRLLRGIGNQTGRSRMHPDTTLRPDLPPRCVALATGEHTPEGHSTNARLLLQPVDSTDNLPGLTARLTAAQGAKDFYSETMAVYVQWIAQQWDALEAQAPLRFRALRDEAAALGTHTREPSHIAHVQLAWRVFTACALAVGAITADEREAILTDTWRHFQALVTTQGVLLHLQTTVPRFLGLLMSGFAAKRIYVRALDDAAPLPADPQGQDGPEAWGWATRTIEGWQGHTETVYEPGHAKMVGYIDTEYVYLLPEPLQEYLAQASRAADQTWALDAKTLYRELDEAGLLTVKPVKTWVERLWGKKIHGRTVRVLHIKRAHLLAVSDEEEARTPAETDSTIDNGVPL